MIVAPEEQQRLLVSVDEVHADNAAHDDDMVTGIHHGMDVAVDGGQHAGQRRPSVFRWLPLEPSELVRPVAINARDTASCSSARTFTQKRPAARIRGHVGEVVAAQNAISGGLADTDVNEFTVMPPVRCR